MKRMNRYSLALISAGLMLAACPLLAREALAPSAPPSLADVALPPALDRVLREYERAWRGGHAAALAALFTEDGFVLQNGQPPVRGRSSIEAAYTGKGGPLRLRALAYDAGESSGSIIGAYGFDQQAGDAGKFTLTLRRTTGGKWLIFSDMDNLNRTRASTAAPGTPPTNGH